MQWRSDIRLIFRHRPGDSLLDKATTVIGVDKATFDILNGFDQFCVVDTFFGSEPRKPFRFEYPHGHSFILATLSPRTIDGKLAGDFAGSRGSMAFTAQLLPMVNCRSLGL
jgi:hypothetical protein